ncbi:MAG: hypothetical protein IH831_07320 [Planctomycetes bacterium]|nr:hypothetical protein [Planctomycetota bacterium]
MDPSQLNRIAGHTWGIADDLLLKGEAAGWMPASWSSWKSWIPWEKKPCVRR